MERLSRYGILIARVMISIVFLLNALGVIDQLKTLGTGKSRSNTGIKVRSHQRPTNTNICRSLAFEESPDADTSGRGPSSRRCILNRL